MFLLRCNQKNLEESYFENQAQSLVTLEDRNCPVVTVSVGSHCFIVIDLRVQLFIVNMFKYLPTLVDSVNSGILSTFSTCLSVEVELSPYELEVLKKVVLLF